MRIVLIIFVLLSVQLVGQEKWEVRQTYSNRNIVAWDVDPMGKVIVAERDVMVKLDTSFQVLFTQSIKQFGEIASLDAAHSLKTLVFSEQQQYVVFVDNTLTIQDTKKELSDYGVAYATNVGYSNHTNRLWVFDGDNAQLLLIDESGNQISRINNLTSIVGAAQPDALYERDNELLLFYKGVGVFVFDYYGTMISSYSNVTAEAVHFTKHFFYFVQGNRFMRVDRRTDQVQEFELPEARIINIRVHQNDIYIEYQEGIKKYSLIH